VRSSARAHVSAIKDPFSGGLAPRKGAKCLMLGKNSFMFAQRDLGNSPLKDEGRKIEASIRKATSTGRPLGSERFIKILERDILPKKAGLPKKKR
jgi:hypothetical protein